MPDIRARNILPVVVMGQIKSGYFHRFPVGVIGNLYFCMRWETEQASALVNHSVSLLLGIERTTVIQQSLALCRLYVQAIGVGKKNT